MGSNSFGRPHSMPPYSDGGKFAPKDPMSFSETGSALANVELWVQQQNASLQEGPFSPSFGPPGKQPRSRSNGGQRWLPSPNRASNASSMGDFMGPGPDQMIGPPGFMGDPQMPRGMMPGGPPGMDENLTPEQLQRREEQLAHLQKLKNMLFPEKRNDFDPRRPPGMFSGPRPGPDGMMGMLRFPHPNMMPPQPGMMEPHEGMMGMDMDPGFFGGPPGLPPNFDSMSKEEKEWFHLQQEYYMERQKQQMQMARGGGPPPGYFGDMPPRMSGPLSPVSPSFNGSGSRDHQGFFFQGPPSGMNFPMNGPGPDFHPDFIPGMGEGMFPFGPNGPGGRMHPGGHEPLPGMFGPGAARFPGICKQKRRRNAGDKPDDIYRHLQPAPSPQQFCSLNLFEGQELTITRQLNLAYQESEDPSPSQSSSNQPKKKKKVDSLSKQRSDELKAVKSEMPHTPELFSSASSLQSPLAAPNISTPNTNNATPQLSLSPAVAESTSHLPAESTVTSVSGISASAETDGKHLSNHLSSTVSSAPSSAPTTIVSKSGSVMSNITSATLASLAKGVESLSDRMQQDMAHGGPFRTVQMPENEQELGEDSPTGGNPAMQQGLVRLRPDNQDVRLKSPSMSMDAKLGQGGNGDMINQLHSDAKENEQDKLQSFQDGATLSGIENTERSPGKFLGVEIKNAAAQNSVPNATILSPRGMVGNANVQIEASAPNTIQYMPARPCGPHGDAVNEPQPGCVTMPFDSAQMIGNPSMQQCPMPGPPPGYNGPMPDYGGPMHGPGGPMPGFDGPMQGGPMPVFDGPMHMQMGPGFDGQMPGEMGSMPGYNSPMHGQGGPVPGFNNGPMPGFNNQGGPMPGYDGQGGPMPGFDGSMQSMQGYNGPLPPPGCNGPGGYGGPMHMHGCIPGFDGPCGPMPEFDMPGHGGPPISGGPMPGYGGPMPNFGGPGPRHGGPMPNHCGPMAGYHGGPPPMNMQNPDMFMPGRMQMMPGEQPGMMGGPGGNGEPSRVKSESSIRKEKDRKKRSESSKKNQAANQANMAADGGSRDAGKPGMMRMGHGKMRPEMIGIGPPGGMRHEMMGLGPMDGRMRHELMGMGPMDGGMKHDMPGMGPMDGGLRFEMVGMGPGEVIRPGMMGPGEGRIRPGSIRPGEDGMRPDMMGMGGPMEGMMRSGNMMMQEEMMRMGMMPGRDGGMMDLSGMVMNPAARILNAAECGMRPGSNNMASSPGGEGMRPSSGAMSNRDGRKGGNGMFGGEGSNRSTDSMVVPSPRAEENRNDGGGMMGDGSKRNILGSGPGDGGMRPGSGLMMAMDPGDNGMRPGSRSLSDKVMMSMGSNDGMRPGSALMMGMGPGDMGMRPGSGMMMAPGEMRHGSGFMMNDGGMRPEPGMMMQMGLEGGMRPGSATMMGLDSESSMSQGPGMMMQMGDGGMRPGSAMMMDGGMRPGSDMMMGMVPNPGDMRPGSEMMMGMRPGDGPMRPGSELMMGMPMGQSDGMMLGSRPGSMGRMMDMDPRMVGEMGMMCMPSRGGRMDPGMPMMDLQNGEMFPNAMMMDPSQRGMGMDPDQFGMGPMGIGPQFHQFQQQLYAKKHPSPSMDMRGPPHGGNMPFDMMRPGPNFGPHGGGLVHGDPSMGMGR